MPGGVAQVGIAFSLYLTDILTLSHHVELVLYSDANEVTDASYQTMPPLRLLSNASHTDNETMRLVDCRQRSEERRDALS